MAVWLFVFAYLSFATYLILFVSDFFNERGRAGQAALDTMRNDFERVLGLSFRSPTGRHERTMLVSLAFAWGFGFLAVITWVVSR